MADAVVSHAFSHGEHRHHVHRLAAYWAEALGGPPLYSDQHGNETAVVRMHSGNGLHDEMDQRAIACFDRALEDVGLAADEPLRSVLHHYLAWATTTSMDRYREWADDVPAGMGIPSWSREASRQTGRWVQDLRPRAQGRGHIMRRRGSLRAEPSEPGTEPPCRVEDVQPFVQMHHR